MKLGFGSYHWRQKTKGRVNKQQDSMDYWDLMNRLNKTMYYGTKPKTERPSLALTDVAVDKFTYYDTLFPSLENLHMEKASALSREACISPCSLVLAMVYIDRLGTTNPNFLASVPSSKLFIVSVMVASKFLHDEGEEDEVFNDEWANSVNMELAELNKLERDFLQAINWRLFVDETEFARTLLQVEKKIALKESSKRGWFSYTDLNTLTENSKLSSSLDLLASHLATVTIACTAAYIASLLTLFGSAAIVVRLPWNQRTTGLESFSLGTEISTDISHLPIHERLNSTELPDILQDAVEEHMTPFNGSEPFILPFESFRVEPKEEEFSRTVPSSVLRHALTRHPIQPKFNYLKKPLKNIPVYFCNTLEYPNCAIAA